MPMNIPSTLKDGRLPVRNSQTFYWWASKIINQTTGPKKRIQKENQVH